MVTHFPLLDRTDSHNTFDIRRKLEAVGSPNESASYEQVLAEDQNRAKRRGTSGFVWLHSKRQRSKDITDIQHFLGPICEAGGFGDN